MYAKCGSLDDACRVFQRMKNHDVVSWNAMIMALAQCNRSEAALRLFAEMLESGFMPNARTFVAVLQACGELAGKRGILIEGRDARSWCLQRGFEIHSQVMSCDQIFDLILGNKLIDMYAKCGSLTDARRVFEQMPSQDIVSYNVMLFGYADSIEGESALLLYDRLRDQGIVPNAQTLIAALMACSSCAVKEEGRQIDDRVVKIKSLERGSAIHLEVVEAGLETEIKVASTLVDMYAKCGCMEKASQVFGKMKIRDVVSWNSMVLGYTQSGEEQQALFMFGQMQEDGVMPDALAFVSALKACSAMAAKEEGIRRSDDGKIVKARCLKLGKMIYSEAASIGLEDDAMVMNMVLDTYAKCGSMPDAEKLFDARDRDVVAWNAMILGYAQCGEPDLGLLYFRRLLEEGSDPNEATLVVVLKACGVLGDLNAGRMIYEECLAAGLVQENSATIAGSVIGFYGKCGSMIDAQRVFDSIPSKNLIVWNALIAGYAHLGDGERAFEIFEMMRAEDSRVHPDGVTFLSLLSVCSHSGFVSRGKELFDLMRSPVYRIAPRIEHYSCMVDLLGRANQLSEAVDLLGSMPCRPSLAIWKTVLGACWKWKNVEVAKVAFEEIQKLDRSDGSAYVLMANTFTPWPSPPPPPAEEA